MLKTLVGLGLKDVEAEVYVFLAINGPREAKSIGTALKLSKQKLYRCLKNLQDKSIVTSSTNRPACFSAVIIESVLDLFLKEKIEQQKTLYEIEEELLVSWKSEIKKEFRNS